MRNFLSKWLTPISFVMDVIFTTWCLYKGEIILGVAGFLCGLMNFIEIVIMTSREEE